MTPEELDAYCSNPDDDSEQSANSRPIGIYHGVAALCLVAVLAASVVLLVRWIVRALF